MNASWQEFLCASGARVDQDLVADFGDAAAELLAARAATIVAPLAHLGVIEVGGAEAASFSAPAVDQRRQASRRRRGAAFGLVLGKRSHAGQLSGFPQWLQLSVATVCRSAAGDSQAPADVRAAQQGEHRRPLRTLVRSSVSRARSAEEALHAAGLAVPGAALRCRGLRPTASSSASTVSASKCSPAARPLPSSGKQLLPVARPVGTRVWQWLDIDAGLPLITGGTREEFVPQMANFDQLGGVSFHKGCYPGQEIIARTQYLGKVKRHLYRAHSSTPIAPGSKIYSPANPEHPCGMIVNAAPAPTGGYDALAIVQESFVAAADLEIAAPGGAHIDLQPLAR
jgi:folate-binding protein YgfZ